MTGIQLLKTDYIDNAEGPVTTVIGTYIGTPGGLSALGKAHEAVKALPPTQLRADGLDIYPRYEMKWIDINMINGIEYL